MPRDVIESAIQTALRDADAEGLRGHQITPYLLARIVQLTGGQSMRANIELLKHNARVAAEIAAALYAAERAEG